MKTDITLTSADRARLKGLVGYRNTSADVVWRWQTRFAEDSVEGLLPDRTRPLGEKPLPQKIKLRVLKMTASDTPTNAKRWSVRTRAKAVGISHAAVQRTWNEVGL